MSTILFVSPHLDDAVISCGAHILHKVHVGQRVHIATVFTQPGDNASEAHQLLYQQRQQDDIKATSLLGAQAMHLGFIDAPFRSAQYYDFSTILFHHQLPSTDAFLPKLLADRLKNVIQELQPDEVWFPLGVGGHIDHHIVFESSKLLWNSTPQFNYYEDLPYALLDGWQAVRWQQVGAFPLSPSTAKIKKISLIDTSLPFVHNYLASENDRAASTNLFKQEWNMLEQNMSSQSSWYYTNNHFDHCTHSVHNLQQKIDAITCYTTEWQLLFGCEKGSIEHMLKSTEHFWRKRP